MRNTRGLSSCKLLVSGTVSLATCNCGDTAEIKTGVGRPAYKMTAHLFESTNV